MDMRTLFPAILITLDVLAGMTFAWHRDYVSCGYWLCAAGISAFALLKQLGW